MDSRVHNWRNDRRAGQGGFTLAELLVASLVLLLLLAGTSSLISAAARNWRRLTQVQELQSEAMRLAASISRDVRQATAITTPTAGSPSAAVGMEPDALTGTGQVTLSRPFDSNPGNDLDDVVRKTYEREQDPAQPAGVYRLKKDASNNPIPMYWYEGRVVTYRRDPSDATRLLREESYSWDKVNNSQEAGITPARITWQTSQIMTRNLKKLVFYPYRPASIPNTATDPASNYRMYRLLITLEHSGGSAGQSRAATFQLKQLVYHRIP